MCRTPCGRASRLYAPCLASMKERREGSGSGASATGPRAREQPMTLPHFRGKTLVEAQTRRRLNAVHLDQLVRSAAPHLRDGHQPWRQHVESRSAQCFVASTSGDPGGKKIAPKGIATINAAPQRGGAIELRNYTAKGLMTCRLEHSRSLGRSVSKTTQLKRGSKQGVRLALPIKPGEA